MKKHILQMTQEEVKILKERIRKSIAFRRPLTLTEHCRERMLEKDIAMYDLIMVLKYYDLVEYHVKEHEYFGDDERVVLRGKKTYNGKNICISYSIVKKRVITAYINNIDDNHDTLDEKNYCESLKIGI